MAENFPQSLDLSNFVRQFVTKPANPRRAVSSARQLLRGASRIRPGLSKSTEAVGAWIDDLASDVEHGEFARNAELREAVVAAAEEVDAAARVRPSVLPRALYRDALDTVGGADTTKFWAVAPWCLAGLLAGVLVGAFLIKR